MMESKQSAEQWKHALSVVLCSTLNKEILPVAAAIADSEQTVTSHT